MTNKINEEQNFLPTQATTPENSSYDRWVISPKFETPVLNFKDADHYNVLKCANSERTVTDAVANLYNKTRPNPEVLGQGTGMWAGYGKLQVLMKASLFPWRRALNKEKTGKRRCLMSLDR